MLHKDCIFIITGLGLIACLLAVSTELNTYAYATMLDYQSVTHAPVWVTSMWTLAAALLPLLWFSRLSLIHTLFSIGVYIAAVISLMFAAAYIFRIWIPPVPSMLAILLTYPLWSFVRLRSSQAALDRALQNLQDEMTELGMEPETEELHNTPDVQQERVMKLAATLKHLRDMHESRSDTLVFISHDIRAPLGAATLLLDKFEQNKYTERMAHLLQRAYAMAEGFLQASRAEMSDVNKYYMLDMASLTQQVIDDIYEILDTKGIVLQTNIPESGIWVRGDFGLLFRAVSNILLNAVSYSPERSVIKVSMDNDEATCCLNVVDEGPGIPEDKIQKLFRRFSRIDGEHQVQDGSGLGLYFVGITIRKHRGTVAVESKSGQGAKFIITLPLERRKSNIPVTYDRRVKPQPAFEDSI